MILHEFEGDLEFAKSILIILLQLINCILIIVLIFCLNELRREMYLLNLEEDLYGMLTQMLWQIVGDNILFEIPAGLRPNHYHRRFHLSCFRHDIIEYGVTIQVMPDDRQVGHRSLNVLGNIFQLPEVHIPPVTAG